jgi:NTE family protein
MTVRVHDVDKRLGLALSGGGFRAAAFHLGVFKKLRELELLDKVDLLSCVSGGSIAGGFLARHFRHPNALELFETYLKTKSIAVSSVLLGLLDPFESRTDKLARSYDEHLFSGATLKDLDAGPRIYFNATSLATGNLFFFAAGGGQREPVMGDHELGTHAAPDFLVSRAVAASSSFPPVFSPLRLSAEEFPPTSEVEYVTLTDGGVYDNLGVNPLLLERNALDYAIVSDGGSPFRTDARPNESGLGVMTSLIEILMEQIRGLQFGRMENTYAARRGPKPMWFSIDSSEGEAQPGDARLASAVSTNLRRLSNEQMEVLMRHGGALVEARLRAYAPELLLPLTPVTTLPAPKRMQAVFVDEPVDVALFDAEALSQLPDFTSVFAGA